MSRSLLLALSLSLLPGCVIYDMGKCGLDTGDDGRGGGDGRDDEAEEEADEPAPTDDKEEPTDEEPSVDAKWALSVAEGAPGEVLLTGLLATPHIDYNTIEALTFLGEVSVQDSAPRADELTLSLAVGAEAPLGPVDLLIELADGDAVLVHDIFTVVDPAAEPAEEAPADEEGPVDTGC